MTRRATVPVAYVVKDVRATHSAYGTYGACGFLWHSRRYASEFATRRGALAFAHRHGVVLATDPGGAWSDVHIVRERSHPYGELRARRARRERLARRRAL